MAVCKECEHYKVCLVHCSESVLRNRGICEHFKSGWISVKDRLPENPKERVLVKTHSDCIVGNPKIDTDRYRDGMWVRYGDNVTHWMPLPEPPKED